MASLAQNYTADKHAAVGATDAQKYNYSDFIECILSVIDIFISYCDHKHLSDDIVFYPLLAVTLSFF